MKPIHFILLGLFLVILGVIIPLLMVIKVVESTLFLGFSSYIVSIVGLFLGMWGAFSYVRIERIKHKKRNEEEGYSYESQR
ncbi:MAG: hypothetical protein J7K85_03715 [Anaerolineaceae bacterium]|nr:hypothetical protein [Anaerolineaceae bacterium]